MEVNINIAINKKDGVYTARLSDGSSYGGVRSASVQATSIQELAQKLALALEILESQARGGY